jgi:hypothetical protein
MSVFGFFNVKAVYYPWFLLTYHLVMGNGLNIFYIMGFVGKDKRDLVSVKRDLVSISSISWASWVRSTFVLLVSKET